MLVPAAACVRGCAYFFVVYLNRPVLQSILESNGGAASEEISVPCCYVLTVASEGKDYSWDGDSCYKYNSKLNTGLNLISLNVRGQAGFNSVFHSVWQH